MGFPICQIPFDTRKSLEVRILIIFGRHYNNIVNQEGLQRSTMTLVDCIRAHFELF